jgi:VCBS repeat-containing protein
MPKANDGTRPTARNDILATGENGTSNLPVLANDLGATQKDKLTIVALAAPDLFGAVTIAPDGQSLVWNDVNGAFDHLGAGETMAVGFTYTVQAGNDALATATVALTVTGEDDAPRRRGPDGDGARGHRRGGDGRDGDGQRPGRRDGGLHHHRRQRG